MIKLKNLITELTASEDAKRRGLVHKGWGRYADSSGKIVAKSVKGRLVTVSSNADAPHKGAKSNTDAPHKGAKSKSTFDPSNATQKSYGDSRGSDVRRKRSSVWQSYSTTMNTPAIGAKNKMGDVMYFYPKLHSGHTKDVITSYAQGYYPPDVFKKVAKIDAPSPHQTNNGENGD